MSYQPSLRSGPTAPISLFRITLEELSSPPVVRGVAYWRSLRGTRRFPSRHALSTREMLPFLRYVALIQVLNGGEDYRFGLVGDAHIDARGYDFSGETIAEMRAEASSCADRSFALCEYIRTTGVPYALRAPITTGGTGWYVANRECAFLPLGPNDSLVDYLFVVGAYAFQALAD